MRRIPRPDQIQGKLEILKELKVADRCQAIRACRTGKTFLSIQVSEEYLTKLKTKKWIHLVLVPSLSLMKQFKDEWLDNREIVVPYACVCSDLSVTTNTYDQELLVDSEMGGKVFRDNNDLNEFLVENDRLVIFCTYQSLEFLAISLKKTKRVVDIANMDEAHRTASVKADKGESKGFTLVHDNKFIKINKRIYWTATPKVLGSAISKKAEENGVEAYSMSDEKVFGKVAHELGILKAKELNLVTDWKIVAISASNDNELSTLIKKSKKKDSNITYREMAMIKVLDMSMARKRKKIIIYFNTIEASERFVEIYNKFGEEKGKDFYIGSIKGSDNSSIRKSIFDEYTKAKTGVLVNARTLVEGVNLPCTDTVIFADERCSVIDIVQSSCRPLTVDLKNIGKIAEIIIPIFDTEAVLVGKEFTKGEAYGPIVQVIRAMSSVDNRIQGVVENLTKDNTEGSSGGGSGSGGMIEIVGLSKNFDRTKFMNGAIKEVLISKIFKPRRKIEEADMELVASLTNEEKKNLHRIYLDSEKSQGMSINQVMRDMIKSRAS